MSSNDSVFAAVFPLVFNCFREHGYKFTFAHYDFQSEEEDEFYIFAPEDLSDIKESHIITRYVDKFEDVPADEYHQIVQLLKDSVKGPTNKWWKQ
ncbi:Hypothetical protein HVR_LOCUS682 [uncultured virus]|nr:Hypothetical protein HVR_LOCUS682 [uncultured virus]